MEVFALRGPGVGFPHILRSDAAYLFQKPDAEGRVVVLRGVVGPKRGRSHRAWEPFCTTPRAPPEYPRLYPFELYVSDHNRRCAILLTSPRTAVMFSESSVDYFTAPSPLAAVCHVHGMTYGAVTYATTVRGEVATTGGGWYAVPPEGRHNPYKWIGQHHQVRPVQAVRQTHMHKLAPYVGTARVSAL